jgi:uncharacterized phage protein gp47/JayE
MQESWIDKPENVIRDDIVSIAKEKTGLTNFKSTGVLRGFLEVLASVVFFIYKTAINPIYSNASLDGATGFFLSLWGLMLGVVRKKESKTVGEFTGTAYGNGSIAAGTWAVVEGTEIRFKTQEKITFQSGQAFSIPVIAEFPGSSYNIGPRAPVRLTRVVSGLDTVFVGDDWIITPGQETEEDDPYRERIKSRWSGQILGDPKEVYRYYAEAVEGVRSAEIIRAPRGPGTTDVIVATVNGLPSMELLQAVRQNLYSHELLGFDVQVKAPTVQTIAVEIEYSGDSSEGEVTLIAEDYVRSLGIGGRFAKSKLYELYQPLNLNSLEILSPDRDVQAGAIGIIDAVITVTRVAA